MNHPEKPDLHVIVGPNGSGKSSIINSTGLTVNCPLIINPDNFVRQFSEIEDVTDRYIAAMEYCREQREMLLEMGVSFGFETVGSHPEKLEFIKHAKLRGYRIHIIFVDSGNPELSIQRIKMRVAKGGHDVPVDKVRSRYAKVINLLPDYFDVGDTAVYIATWLEPPQILISKCEDNVEILTDDIRMIPGNLFEHLRTTGQI